MIATLAGYVIIALIVAAGGVLLIYAIAYIESRVTPMATPATDMRHGILKAFDAGTYLATVQFTGSLQQFIAGIPTARDIAAAELTSGRKVAVAFFDPSNHKDAVLFAVWT